MSGCIHLLNDSQHKEEESQVGREVDSRGPGASLDYQLYVQVKQATTKVHRVHDTDD